MSLFTKSAGKRGYGLLRVALRLAYERHTDNHPTIHCNRFLSWGELTGAEREQWAERAAAASPRQPQGHPQEAITLLPETGEKS